MPRQAHIRQLGLREYSETFDAMRDFTHSRTPETPDELWFLEHPPVYTQGQAGRPEHLLAPGSTPVIQSNRGGQVTYHGPGQIVVYVLLDLHRLGYGVRTLVTRLEQSIIQTLAGYGISAAARRDAPGVYVNGAKIASLGLRITRGRSYHGIALNTCMDLAPFSRINPCGLAGLPVTQVSDLGGPPDAAQVRRDLETQLLQQLGLICSTASTRC